MNYIQSKWEHIVFMLKTWYVYVRFPILTIYLDPFDIRVFSEMFFLTFFYFVFSGPESDNNLSVRPIFVHLFFLIQLMCYINIILTSYVHFNRFFIYQYNFI